MADTATCLYLYDPEFEDGAKAFQADEKKEGRSCVIRQISCMDTMKAAFQDYTGVEHLYFDTHGDPGILKLPGGNVDGADFLILRLIPDTLLAPGARVLFYGCALGAGTEGDTFMDDFGRGAFRGKGGIVGATTVTNFILNLGGFATSRVWMELESMTGARLKVVRYDGDGNRVAARSVNRWGKPD